MESIFLRIALVRQTSHVTTLRLGIKSDRTRRGRPFPNGTLSRGFGRRDRATVRPHTGTVVTCQAGLDSPITYQYKALPLDGTVQLAGRMVCARQRSNGDASALKGNRGMLLAGGFYPCLHLL